MKGDGFLFIGEAAPEFFVGALHRKQTTQVWLVSAFSGGRAP